MNVDASGNDNPEKKQVIINHCGQKKTRENTFCTAVRKVVDKKYGGRDDPDDP